MATFASIAETFGVVLESPIEVLGVSPSTTPEPNTLAFLSSWDPSAHDLIEHNPYTLFLIPLDAMSAPNVIAVGNPRLAYALAVQEVLATESEPGVASTAMVAPSARVDRSAFVDHFAVIEEDVEVGPRSSIGSHAVLKSGVRIGTHTRIGSHTVIGGTGFGFEVDDEGTPVRVHHVGGVLIGDEVEIGSHVTIAQGTIEPTRIADHVKIDDCVFVAHNVRVGEASYLIAGAEISGSVVIGRRVWVSPEAAVINKVVIGDDALIGIGAVVTKNVAENTIVAGVPARPLGPRYK